MYILIYTKRTVNCYKRDPSSEQWGPPPPHEKQNRNCLNYNQKLGISPGGAQSQG
jgi:hypothetical protein